MDAEATVRNEPSKGLGFGTGMLAFMVGEIAIFAGIDSERWTDSHLTLIVGMVVIAVVHAVGMLMTYLGRYTLGGNLQIVASVTHIVDIMGVLGIIGGLLSRKYPQKIAAAE